MEDVWVKRINAIGDSIAKVVIAVASIVAAWQSINNANAIKEVRAQQEHQIQVMGTR